MANNLVVKVKRETIVACMTCPLCNKLLRDATTITECLHSFCRKCINKKFVDEEMECCPVCEIPLGAVPSEKLSMCFCVPMVGGGIIKLHDTEMHIAIKQDHSLQDVRAKIFPLKRRKVSTPEAVPSVSLPVRRKERSLSSLVVSAPRVSAQTTMTRRRTNTVARKAAALRGSSISMEKPFKKEEDSMEDNQDWSSSPETLNKLSQNGRQSSSSAHPGQSVPDKETEYDAEQCDAKSDLWKPLNFLVEVASRTRSFKCNSQGSDAKLESADVHDKEIQGHKTKNKEDKLKSKIEDKTNSTDPTSSETGNPKKLRRIRRKTAVAFGDSNISPQSVLEANGAKYERRSGPIWFSLVASEVQGGGLPLPQIPASYLRIRDGKVPVSFIQKYLMKKLNLINESEVEIKCMGQSLIPTLELYNLVDLWLQTASTPEKVAAKIGSSAKDFVMVLTYARKVHSGFH
ncbi:E3 ubiquitin protein ligase DRIP2-like isoform X2 [Mangifera indica]|uniref:E3 ubiquitin protein ligase DRIP2-like isoform X2 n=1 Tax=Mangifera indica TaxID=29780 RepID=UPI001CFAFE51|nr:E3 ubiquitin protein ligase DRIP2-like isoform X2 [Mangifera indica]